jgi:FkbM family methyltransferase
MKKVYFTNNWGESPENLLKRYSLQTPNSSGKWNSLEGILSIDDADYVIVLDEMSPSIKELAKEKKTIFVQREPKEIKPITFKPSTQTIFVGTHNKHYQLATWFIKKDFNWLKKFRKPNKSNVLSAVISGKNETQIQKKRIELLEKLVNKKTNIDIFGRDHKNSHLQQSYKGELNSNGNCKFNGLSPYKFSLAIENSEHINYFTEKIVDCFLTWTKPLYWGCPNIAEYFPNGSYSWIDIYADNVIEQINNALNEPVDYEAIRKARELVLHKYNLWSSLENIIIQNESSKQFFTPNKITYFSQIEQDKILDKEVFEEKENGSFIEVGAVDGKHFSNTLFFEKYRNWSGICIEPNPTEFKKLLKSGRSTKNYNVAISTNESSLDFLTIDGYGKGLSGLKRHYDARHLERISKETAQHQSKIKVVKVNTIPLQKIIDENNLSYIDYCSIDVEGAEIEVLRSIDFNKTYIKCFTIENNYNESTFKEYLEPLGYVLWKKIKWEEIYIKEKSLREINNGNILKKLRIKITDVFS